MNGPGGGHSRTIGWPGKGLSWAEGTESTLRLRREFRGRLAPQMMFIAADQDRADEMATPASSLYPDEVQLNTRLCPSPTALLSQGEMAEIKAVFSGLPSVSTYKARRPVMNPLEVAEMRWRRPGESRARIEGKEVS